MAAKDGASAPQPSFFETNEEGRDGRGTGCEYETPSGRCGDPSTRHSIDGVRVALCEEHLVATLEENDLDGRAG